MFSHAQGSPAIVIPVVMSSQLKNTGSYSQDVDVTGLKDGYDYMPAELREQLRSLQEFTADGEFTGALGMVVRESREKLEDSGEVSGLMVYAVQPDSPAAEAG